MASMIKVLNYELGNTGFTGFPY